MKPKTLRKKGEFDYDYIHDILFFKTKNREYDRSIELANFVIDIDKENFIVGIQIFDASEFLRVPKTVLKSIPKWQFCASVNENRIEIRLVFQVVHRNKIIERSPIIIEPLRDSLPNSEMVCAAV